MNTPLVFRSQLGKYRLESKGSDAIIFECHALVSGEGTRPRLAVSILPSLATDDIECHDMAWHGNGETTGISIAHES